MKLIFEKSVAGRRCAILPACDVDPVELPEGFARTEAPSLPEISTPCLRGPVPSPGSSSSPGRAGSLSRGTALIPPSIPCLPANPL